MCTDDSTRPGGAPAGFASVAEALRAARAAVDYLNSPAARDLDGAASGEALVAIGAIASGLSAAQNGLLRRFDADSAHDGDGYATTAADGTVTISWAREMAGPGPARSATRTCSGTPTRSSSKPPPRGRTWTGCGSSPRPPTRPGAPPTPTTTHPEKGSRTASCNSTPPWTARGG